MLPRIGIIGGSGFYQMSGLRNRVEHQPETPFGNPSAPIVTGLVNDIPMAFLARHGLHHTLNPSEVPYRANLFALHKLGVRICVSITAVGSLKPEIKPSELVIPDQYVDLTWGRQKTFFEKGVVAHVSLADPTCPHGRALLTRLAPEAGLTVHPSGTYVNMEGPQFSTRAESHLYRSHGHDVIGMTQAAEAKLARELQMCFLPLAFVTDFDCWHEEEEEVSVSMVVATLKANVRKAQELVHLLAPHLADYPRNACACGQSLEHAIMTPREAMSPSAAALIDHILGS